MFCTKCGNEIPSGNRFCTECGAPIDVAATAGGVINSDSSPIGANPTSANDPYGINSDYASSGSDYASTGSDYASSGSDYASSRSDYGSDYGNSDSNPYGSYNSATNGNTYSNATSATTSSTTSAAEDPELAKMGQSAMVTGIVAAAMSCSFFLSIVGVILGIVGLTKVSKAKKAGYRRAKVHVGFGLSLYAIIVGVILTFYLAFYVMMVIFAITHGGV